MQPLMHISCIKAFSPASRDMKEVRRYSYHAFLTRKPCYTDKRLTVYLRLQITRVHIHTRIVYPLSTVYVYGYTPYIPRHNHIRVNIYGRQV